MDGHVANYSDVHRGGGSRYFRSGCCRRSEEHLGSKRLRRTTCHIKVTPVFTSCHPHYLSHSSFSPSMYERHTVFSVVIGGFVYWTSFNAVNQMMVQRYLALPNVQQSQMSVARVLTRQPLFFELFQIGRHVHSRRLDLRADLLLLWNDSLRDLRRLRSFGIRKDKGVRPAASAVRDGNCRAFARCAGAFHSGRLRRRP